MSFKLASSEAIAYKCGIGRNTKLTTSGAVMAIASDEAESFVNLYTRYNFTSGAPSLYASTSSALQEAASNIAAIKLINQDITTYQAGEAETMVNILNYQAFQILDKIKDDVFRKFVIDGTTGVT